MHLDLETHSTLDDVRGFLAGNPEGTALVPERKQAYAQIGRVLRRFSYWRLGKADKGLLRCYLARTTGLSRAQLARLIARYLAEGELADRRQVAAKPFRRKYERVDILLLAETDELHGRLSGPATLAILKRAWEVFGDERFQRLAGLSNGHLYNLRRSQTYLRRMGSKDLTRPAQMAIAERRRPRPGGLPGYLRIDSVHQGDLDKVKGVYHIDVVDEVTQYQFVGSVERISEHYLMPVLESLLEAFPFRIRSFHSDYRSRKLATRERRGSVSGGWWWARLSGCRWKVRGDNQRFMVTSLERGESGRSRCTSTRLGWSARLAPQSFARRFMQSG